MNKLHPRAYWLFLLQGVLSFGIMAFVFSMIFGGAFSSVFLNEEIDPYVRESITTTLSMIGNGILATFLFVCGISAIWAKLYYDTYKYSFEKEGVKIERGVIWKKYVTIPYGRIQNVDILRGPLARILGLSDLQIQTAGASGAILTEGRIPGILREEAEKHRTELVSRLSGNKEGL